MTPATTARPRASSRRAQGELVTALIGKDLKVKYQASVLGFVWSLAMPLVLLLVYSFVFQVVLKSGIPRFGFYLMSGLLIWTAFSGSVSMATDSVVGNAGLVKKVRFPLGVLPLTSIGFNAVHYALQTAVFLAVMVAVGDTNFLSLNLLLLVPALIVAITFVSGLAFLVASLNVRYRDTTHIVEILLLAGFWFSPVVYSVSLVSAHLTNEWMYNLYLLNPMTAVVISSQRALYAQNPALAGGGHVLADPGIAFYLERLGLAMIIASIVCVIGLLSYRRMSGEFAEVL
ncbi:MAG TPA: ABC transporter permease [Acidimicrobiia bacterium]|jgi:ABC-2 type transport system permease protein